jgi:hypothetical protein
MLLFELEGNATAPHHLGRKWDAHESIGRKRQNPSLRPNEMSELLTASERNGMLVIASEGKAAAPHRLGRKSDAPKGIGVGYRSSSLRRKEMSELLTAPD